MYLARPQTGVKVTNVNDLQDIDELCVVEVSWSHASWLRGCYDSPTDHILLRRSGCLSAPAT